MFLQHELCSQRPTPFPLAGEARRWTLAGGSLVVGPLTSQIFVVLAVLRAKQLRHQRETKQSPNLVSDGKRQCLINFQEPLASRPPPKAFYNFLKMLLHWVFN